MRPKITGFYESAGLSKKATLTPEGCPKSLPPPRGAVQKVHPHPSSLPGRGREQLINAVFCPASGAKNRIKRFSPPCGGGGGGKMGHKMRAISFGTAPAVREKFFALLGSHKMIFSVFSVTSRSTPLGPWRIIKTAFRSSEGHTKSISLRPLRLRGEISKKEILEMLQN